MVYEMLGLFFRTNTAKTRSFGLGLGLAHFYFREYLPSLAQ